MARKARERAEAERERQACKATRSTVAIASVLQGQQIAPADDPLAAVGCILERDVLRGQTNGLDAERENAAEGVEGDQLAAEEADPDPVRTDTLRQSVEEAGADRDPRCEVRQALDAALSKAGV